MSDNVIDLFTKKPAVDAPLQFKHEAGKSVTKIELFPGVMPGCSIEIGPAFGVGLTHDGNVVVLYGNDPQIPERLHYQVMENRPTQGWEMAILTTLFGLLQSQESQKKEQAIAPAGEPDPTPTAEELDGWYQNIQWAIARRVAMLDQTQWPARFQHGKVVFHSKGTSAISVHGDSFVLANTTARAVSYSLSKNAVGEPILQLTFVSRGSIGGGGSTWTSTSKVYAGFPYVSMGTHTPEHSAAIAGTTWDDGYPEMLDISIFLATGEAPSEKNN